MSAAARALSITLLIAVVACGQRIDPQSIDGHWVAEKFRLQGFGLPIGPDLFVSRDLIGFGGAMEPLKLTGIAADGREVTLHTEFGLDIVFAFESRDRMYFSLPFTGDRIYYRRDDAAPTTLGSAPTTSKVSILARVAPPAVTPAELEVTVLSNTASTSPVSLPLGNSAPTGLAQIRPDPIQEPSQQASALFEIEYGKALDAMRQGEEDESLRHLSVALVAGFSDWHRIDNEPLFARIDDDVRFKVLRLRWKKGLNMV